MLQVRLLGAITVERDGDRVPLTQPAGRLLAFLAAYPGRHDREDLAARLWTSSPLSAARANLRTTVWQLRKCVGDQALQTSRTAIGLVAAAVQVDVLEALARVAVGDVEAAELLCRSELLPAVSEEWAEAARQRHRATVVAALAGQGERAERSGDAAVAVRWSRLRCELDPLDEPIHAALVRHLAAAGDRAGALVAGRAIAARLRDELGVAPGPVLRAAVAEVRGQPDPATASPPTFRPLYGRQAELQTMVSAWTAARDGSGRVVVLTGEPGIGKTRLVGELVRRADNAGAHVAVGGGIDVGGQVPLAVWHELVPALARNLPTPPETATWPAELGRLAPEVARRLARAGTPPPVAAPELERLRLFDAVLRLVEWAAAARPVLLVADDVHRVDAMSMQLAAHICRRLAHLPVMVVLIRRDRPEQPAVDALIADLTGRGAAVAEIELGPIPASGIDAIARSIVTLTDDEAAEVVRAADGNPLLAVQTARALHAGGPAPAAGLRPLVRAALAPAPRPARTLIDLLATAGRALTAAELACLPVPDLDDAQRGALDTGLVRRAGGGLKFGHALFAEAVRADLGDEGSHHERLAHAIDAAATVPAAVAAEVAGHLSRAGRDDLAAPRWARAAEYARSLGALDQALSGWVEAVRCAPTDFAARLELAEIHGWLGQDAAFEREWQAALELAPPAARVTAWLGRGRVLRTVVCHPAGSLAAYRAAAELLPPDAPVDQRIDTLLGVAWGEAAGGSPVRSADLLHEITALVAAPDDATIAELANVQIMTLIRLGRFTECEDATRAGSEAARRSGRPDIAYPMWLHTACALSCAGDLAGALRATEEAVAVAHGSPAIELPCLAGRAFVLSRLGRHADALALAAQQLELADRMDSPAVAALARHDAGLITLAAGRYAEAADLLEAGLDGGAAVSRPAARLARAEALARSGRAEEAAGEVRRAALEPVRAGDLPWTLVPCLARVQGIVAQARGDRELARTRLCEAMAAWRRQAPHEVGAEFLTNFVDLGRPPIVGLVEPARELRRLETEIAELDQLTEVS